jgi:hypothetical protein
MIDKVCREPMTNEYSMGPFMYTWYDVGEGQELWNFVRGPLLGAAYGNANTSCMHPLLEQNWVIGGIQLRQVRVKKDIYEHRDNYNPILKAPVGQSTASSFPEWDPGKQDTAAFFGTTNYTDANHVERTMTYTHNGKLDTLSGLHHRFMRSYGNGGFSSVLHAHESKALNLGKVNAMMADGWLSAGTRAMSIKLNTFNPARGTVTTMELVVEIGSSGLFTLSQELNTFRLDPYSGSGKDTFRVVCELLFICGVINFTHSFLRAIYFREPKGFNPSYFSDVWNVLDFSNLVLYYAEVVTWVVFMVNAERRSLLADEITDYLDLDTPAWCMWMMGFFYSWNM